MPLEPNTPPPLNPTRRFGGQNQEHIDNTNLANPANPKAFRDLAANSGQKTGASDSSDNSGSGNTASGPTVTVSGDHTGSTQVTPETQVQDALAAMGIAIPNFDFKRPDGSSVNLSDAIKGDFHILATSKNGSGSQSGSQSSGSQQTGSRSTAPNDTAKGPVTTPFRVRDNPHTS